MSHYVLVVKRLYDLNAFSFKPGDLFFNFKVDKDWNTSGKWYLITADKRDQLADLKSKNYYQTYIDIKFTISVPQKYFYKLPYDEMTKILYT